MTTLAHYQTFATDNAGNVLPSPTVTVHNESGGTLAPLFSDRAGSSGMTNPFTGGSDGLIDFYVAGGAYKIDIVQGGTTRTLRYVGISTGSEVDFDNDPWTSWTPTIGATSGALGTNTPVGRYKLR